MHGERRENEHECAQGQLDRRADRESDTKAEVGVCGAEDQAEENAGDDGPRGELDDRFRSRCRRAHAFSRSLNASLSIALSYAARAEIFFSLKSFRIDESISIIP